MLVADCAKLQPQLKRHISRGLLDTSRTSRGRSVALSIYWCKVLLSIITFRYFQTAQGQKIDIIPDCIKKCLLGLGLYSCAI